MHIFILIGRRVDSHSGGGQGSRGEHGLWPLENGDNSLKAPGGRGWEPLEPSLTNGKVLSTHMDGVPIVVLVTGLHGRFLATVGNCFHP